MGDKWVKCMTVTGNVRAFALDATESCKMVFKLQELKNDEKQLGAEAVVAALLMAAAGKKK